MGNPAINCYQDRDGRWFWIVGLEGDRHWPPLARAAGHPEWIDDPRFRSTADRAAHATELIAALDAVFATRTREEWGAIFDAEQDLWWAPVQTADEVLADPQVRAGGGFVEVPDGEATTTLPATPVDFEGTPWAPHRRDPGVTRQGCRRRGGPARARRGRLSGSGMHLLATPRGAYTDFEEYSHNSLKTSMFSEN
jgi:crotonobetainyl-CoA:carnitine CoA-transferase CaiB-like acyl-CoA transferase